jgi:hypothetical protein
MTRQQAIDQFVEIAVSEIGTREEGGNNCGAEIRAYQSATWLKPDPWPWCAAFVCWVMMKWLISKEVCELLTLKNQPTVEKFRCRDAAAFGFEKWALKRKIAIFPETELAKKGDIVVFDFSHIGIVTEDQVIGINTIKTVEANTNGRGDRDSVSGDGVWAKERKKDLVKSLIRIL